MPIRRHNPFEELEEFFERMSQQFEQQGQEMWNLGSGFEAMAVDLEDRGDEFVVTADVPGIDKEDITVKIADTTLHIDIEHTEETREETGEYLRQERQRKSMHRSLTLPDAVEEDGIEATYRNGVLTVTIPKAHTSEPARTIDIE